MGTRVANLERIREVVGLIERWENEPGNIKFDMDGWYERSGKDFCDTAVCFAGAAVVHAKIPVYINQDFPGTVSAVVHEDGKTEAIEDWATKYLGLSYVEADSIFYATHITTARDLKRRINQELGEEVFTE